MDIQGAWGPLMGVRKLYKVLADRRALLWAIFLAALLVRMAYIAFLKEGYYFSDFRVYERSALSLMNGGGFDPDYRRPPLYPLFLAANYLFLGRHFFTIRIVQSLLGAYCSVLIYLLGERLFGPRAGKIAAGISIFYPYYVFLSGLLYPTLITTFLLISMLYFLLLAKDRSSFGYYALAVFCLGVAAMATPVSLAFLPFLLLWLPHGVPFPAKRRVLMAGVSVLVVAGCVLPWSVYYYHQHGRVILVDARAAEHLPYFTSGVSKEKPEAEGHSRIAGLLAHPIRTALRTGSEFLHFWTFVPDRVVTKNQDYRNQRHSEDPRLVENHALVAPWLDYVSIFTYGPIFLLALLGLGLNWKRWSSIGLPLLLLLSQALGYSFFFTQVRYRLPVEFCLMLFAGAGVAVLYDKYRKHTIEAGG